MQGLTGSLESGMDREKLAANYAAVMDRANAAAERAGRLPGSWRLVAVTKTVDAETARAICGLRPSDLGENRVQDLVEKAVALAGSEIRWHLIGHLQTNKVKKVVGAVSLIHSVDSLRLAEEIERVAAGKGLAQEVLLEVNVSGEESKFGLGPGEVAELAAAIADMEHVKLVGLMTMAPIVDDPEKTRPVFAGLRELADAVAANGLFARMPYELSMGMTQDFEVAIEEGATLVRVGSALFEGVC